MALFKVLRGNKNNLPTEKHDGYAYFCTDTKDFYIDYIDANSEMQRTKISSDNAEKLRYVKDGATVEITPEMLLENKDWLENDGTKTAYIKNRTHYKEVVEHHDTVWVLNEQSITFNGGMYGSSGEALSVSAGDSIKISWDGTVYEVTALSENVEGIAIIYAGDLEEPKGDPTYPFTLIFNYNLGDENMSAGWSVLCWDDSINGTETSSHTISIYSGGDTVVYHKLDNNYLNTTKDIGSKEDSFITAKTLYSYLYNNRPDCEIEDSNDMRYVKNKLVSRKRFSFSWDGNITDDDVVYSNSDDSIKYRKVKDWNYYPDADHFVDTIINIDNNNNITGYEPTLNGLSGYIYSFTITPDSSTSISPYSVVYVANTYSDGDDETDYTVNGVVIKEEGLYFIKTSDYYAFSIDGYYVNKLSSKYIKMDIHPDLSENDSSKDSYVANRTHWKEEVQTESDTILFEADVSVDGDGIYGETTPLENIAVGDIVNVEWDGTTYECTVKETTINDTTITYIGSELPWDESYAGDEPFLIYPFSNPNDGGRGSGIVAIDGQEGTHSVRIYKNGGSVSYVSIYHKLPNEYLNIDDTPVKGSDNLITSGGVYDILTGSKGSMLLVNLTMSINSGNVKFTADKTFDEIKTAASDGYDVLVLLQNVVYYRLFQVTNNEISFSCLDGKGSGMLTCTSSGWENTDITYLESSDISDWAKQSTKPTYTAEEVGALPDTTFIPSKTSDIDNDSGYISAESDPTVPSWAKQSTKPTYTASEVGADASGTAANEVSSHNSNTSAHNDIRLLIKELTERLNAVADSDDTTLDQMSEIVTYIKNNKSLIDSVTTSKVSVSDIIDNLTTNISNKPLSASQGVALKALIATKADKSHTQSASTITGLATVATSGSYNDLSNKPTIPTTLPANGGNADTVDNKHASDFAAASHTHSYNDLSNKPTILTKATNGFNGAICAGSDGVAEYGKYCDFHNSADTTSDYSTRLTCTGDYKNSVNLPSLSGTLIVGDKGYKIVVSDSVPTVDDKTVITFVVG
ncbi:MAG: hypothetical protein PUB94_05935 [Oscillospiraceae bacterium]|nr:hypothetical protein [Oscillospiraceae bacterium]